MPTSGLSPPMRGNRWSIRSAAPRINVARVYPRPCGETHVSRGHRTGAEGLSPPMRGNPQGRVRNVQSCLDGSIPAHAGKPLSECSSMMAGCPCGETMVVVPYRHHAGSIPAHAGKPSSTDDPAREKRRGLSPPMRGNRRIGVWKHHPAYQGLSPPMRGNHALHCADARTLTPGLSPPMRGNHGYKLALSNLVWAWVYPRPCGETLTLFDRRGAFIMGLSPPMRGNHPSSGRGRGKAEGLSPPMRGNPHRADALQVGANAGVYPRPCGETSSP